MVSIFKGIFRTGLILTVVAGVVGGAAVLIAGPQRTKAVFHQMQDEVMTTIDKHIDDPTALRAQLQELEQEYPARISQVRKDLAELNEQVRQLERERSIAQRVVTLAEGDLAELEPKLAEMDAQRATNPSVRLASAVTFDNKVYSYDRAFAKAKQIKATRIAYANRAADAAHDLTYLVQQAGRLEELLVQLEGERAQFQSQIWQLARQVDAIARNERLIELLDKRNRTIEECSRYEVASLDQLTGRLAEIRAVQEAQLDMLANAQYQTDYEDVARMQMATESLEAAKQYESEYETVYELTPVESGEIR